MAGSLLVDAATLVTVCLSLFATVAILAHSLHYSLHSAFIAFVAACFACSIIKIASWNLFAYDVLEFKDGEAHLSHKLGPVQLAKVNVTDSKIEVISRTVFGGRRPRTEFTLQFTSSEESACLKFGFAEIVEAIKLVEICKNSLSLATSDSCAVRQANGALTEASLPQAQA